jgi:hypothetical protein
MSDLLGMFTEYWIDTRNPNGHLMEVPYDRAKVPVVGTGRRAVGDSWDSL